MREPVLDRRNGRGCYSVAMVAACPFPANHGTPGAIREMSETLAQMGHTVHIVTYPGGQDDIVVRFAKVHRPSPFRPQRNVKVGPSAEKFLLDFAVLRLLCRLIQREPIDIIHGHNYEGAVIGALAGWITRRPVLYHAVNLMSDELPGYRFIRPEWLVKRVAGLLDRLIPIFRDHIIALSPELKEWLATNGTPESKVDVVPCGVNPDIFNSAAPANLGTSFQIRNRPVVMYTGVLNRFQRIEYLLRGFAIALNQEPDALLLIVSPVVSEADKRKHTKLAHKLGISHVIGWIGPHLLEDLPGYLALANVTVISRPDCLGHPIKLLNYMLAGKPIVCFQGAAKGVRHMYDAFIAPDHDCDALGKGIVTLLKIVHSRCNYGPMRGRQFWRISTGVTYALRLRISTKGLSERRSGKIDLTPHRTRPLRLWSASGLVTQREIELSAVHARRSALKMPTINDQQRFAIDNNFCGCITKIFPRL